MTRILILFLAMIALSDVSHAADKVIHDSTWLADENVMTSAITRSRDGLPVGTVMIWPYDTMPEDADNWQECDGSPTKDGSLLAKTMSHVPDFGGYFLRGHGGSGSHVSGDVGKAQDEQVAPHRHYVGAYSGSHGYDTSGSGAHLAGSSSNNKNIQNGLYMEAWSGASSTSLYSGLPTTAHNPAPTAGSPTYENRPVNKAVRYMIKVN